MAIRTGIGILLILAAATAVTAEDEAASQPAATESTTNPVEGTAPAAEAVVKEEGMQSGSLWLYRIHVASACSVLVIFALFIFTGTDIPMRLCGLRRCAPHRLLCGKGGKGWHASGFGRRPEEDCEVPEDDDTCRKESRAAAVARILGTGQEVPERKPLMPAPPQERGSAPGRAAPARAIFDSAVYRYGGLDAAMDALNRGPHAPAGAVYGDGI